MTPEELIAKQAELIELLTKRLEAVEAQSKERDAALAEYEEIAKAPPLAEQPCAACGLVHPTDPTVRPKCRCLYCGEVKPVGGATTDARLGDGVVCLDCARAAGLTTTNYLRDTEAEVLARHGDGPPRLPWER
jgi:hypothetical protein